MGKNNNGTDDQNGSPSTDGTDWKAEAEKWKALSRKHEDQAKANKTELDKLKESSTSSKSEIEKLTEQVTKLTERAEESERKALIAEVAQEKGLTAKQARRLTGKTREELESDADELVELFGITKSDKDDDQDGGGKDSGDGQDDTSGGRRPKSRPKEPGAGGGPGSGDEGFDPKKVADEIFGES